MPVQPLSTVLNSSFLLLALAACCSVPGIGQQPSLTIPSPFATTPTADQQNALNNETAAQDQHIMSVFAPRMQQSIQAYNAQGASGTANQCR